MNKLPLYAALLLLTQCSKCKDDVAPLDQLPPATQTGANTFGCLVNGQPWTPQGNDGTDNYVVLFEPDQGNPSQPGGNLSVRAYRYPNTGANGTSIVVNVYSITSAKSYSLDSPNLQGRASFYNRDNSSPCNEYFINGVSYRQGTLTLTRLDQQAGIISGTFSFTLAKPGCDTIRVTDGRFDYKL